MPCGFGLRSEPLPPTSATLSTISRLSMPAVIWTLSDPPFPRSVTLIRRVPVRRTAVAVSSGVSPAASFGGFVKSTVSAGDRRRTPVSR
jgi:hypothetical protein